MDTRLAVVIPTIGRWTQPQALMSADAMRKPVVLVVDGPNYAPWEIEKPGTTIRLPDGPHGDYGVTARNAGIAHAATLGATHVAYLDDDDAYLPGAVDKVLRWIDTDPKPLHIGRMVRAEDGRVWWTEQRVGLGQIGTPMMIVPIAAAQACPWSAPETGGYDADWRHARDVLAATGRVVFHEDVIAVVRPWGRV